MISNRMSGIKKSFIREILKVAENRNIISFAGGLPNPALFPVEEIKKATNALFNSDGHSILQYSSTEGYLPLREFISQRYKKKEGLDIPADTILITNGSQQALDLLGKVLINEGDNVIIEKPGYLGAIQALSIYRPEFCPLELNVNGINMKELDKIVANKKIKLFYGVPNFQNPSGISYSNQQKKELSKILNENNITFIEDNPYGDLRFFGSSSKSMRSYNESTILLGSFSKIIAPSLRIGWVVAPSDIYEKLVTAKQASDLHTNYLSQRIIHQYLMDNDLDMHIEKIRNEYKKQREIMVSSIEKFFPKDIICTKPNGGMFLWVTLNNKINTYKLFEKSIEEGVAFVPGNTFYTNKEGMNTMRLNYSNIESNKIKKGIQILGNLITNWEE